MNKCYNVLFLTYHIHISTAIIGHGVLELLIIGQLAFDCVYFEFTVYLFYELKKLNFF